MSVKNVQVTLPDELVQLLNKTGDDLSARVREALVLHLFQESTISGGKAAQLLGISKDAFRDLHQRHGIPYFRQTPQELVEEIRAAHAVTDR